MEEYKIGDRILLEVCKINKPSCAGCFFIKANAGDCPYELRATCESATRKDCEQIIYKQIDPSVQKEENNCAFMLGAKVAENKILKSLWHNPEEEIRVKENTFVIVQFTEDNDVQFALWRSNTAHEYQIDLRDNMLCWCYLDDILPKEK